MSIRSIFALCLVAVALRAPATALPYHKWHWEKKAQVKTQDEAPWRWDKPSAASSSRTQSESNCQIVGPAGNKVHLCERENAINSKLYLDLSIKDKNTGSFTSAHLII